MCRPPQVWGGIVWFCCYQAFVPFRAGRQRGAIKLCSCQRNVHLFQPGTFPFLPSQPCFERCEVDRQTGDLAGTVNVMNLRNS